MPLNTGRGAGFNVGGSLVMCAADVVVMGINLAVPLSNRATIDDLIGNLFICGAGIDFRNIETFPCDTSCAFDTTLTLFSPGTGRLTVAFGFANVVAFVIVTGVNVPFGRLIRCILFATFTLVTCIGLGRFNTLGFGKSGGNFEYGNDNRRERTGALGRFIE